jgi:hypothetical protein
MQSIDVRKRQGVKPGEWMDPRVPQHLVHHEVSRSGDESLVHQGCLHLPTTTAEEVAERAPIDRQRVRAQWSEDPFHLVRVVGQPQSAELAHVPVPELAAVKDEDHPVVPVPAVPPVSPHQVSRHAEVQERRGSGGPCDQPLAAPLRFLEPMATERLVQHLRRRVAQDRRVRREDLLDPPAHSPSRQRAAEVLDVGELRH